MLFTVLLIVVPLYVFELITNSFYYRQDVFFFVLSGWRLYLFLAYLPVAALAAGYLIRRPWLAVLSSIGIVLILLALLYRLCDPRVCYNLAPDGLAPVRLGTLLAAEGLLGAMVGSWLKTRKSLTGKSSFLIGIATFYALAYYPMMFTLGGTRLTLNLHPFPLIFLLGLLSLATSRFVVNLSSSQVLGTLTPVVGSCALLALASGIMIQYAQLMVPFLLASIVVSAVMGAIGSLNPRNGSSVIPEVLRPPHRLLLVSLLASLVVMGSAYPDAVTGLVAQGSGNDIEGRFVQGAPTYVAAFMVGDYRSTKGVSATIDLEEVNRSSVQQSEFIAAGLGVQSPNCCVDRLDYGYRVDLYVLSDGRKAVVASAWETCDNNIACGGLPWRNLMFFSVREVDAGMQRVNLTMMWENRTVNWYYWVDRETSQRFASFNTPRIQNSYFNIGEIGGAHNPPYGKAFFYQSGVMSNSPPSSGKWRITIECPAYLSAGKWACLSNPRILQGDVSYWKVLWRWGEPYPEVDLNMEPEHSRIIFSHSD